MSADCWEKDDRECENKKEMCLPCGCACCREKEFEWDCVRRRKIHEPEMKIIKCRPPTPPCHKECKCGCKEKCEKCKKSCKCEKCRKSCKCEVEEIFKRCEIRKTIRKCVKCEKCEEKRHHCCCDEK